jgi:hypothetical protein
MAITVFEDSAEGVGINFEDVKELPETSTNFVFRFVADAPAGSTKANGREPGAEFSTLDESVLV